MRPSFSASFFGFLTWFKYLNPRKTTDAVTTTGIIDSNKTLFDSWIGKSAKPAAKGTNQVKNPNRITFLIEAIGLKEKIYTVNLTRLIFSYNSLRGEKNSGIIQDREG